MQVVSVTSFNGGNNLDMIPETVVIGGTFRAFSNASFYNLLQRIEEVRRSFHFRFGVLIFTILTFFDMETHTGNRRTGQCFPMLGDGRFL